MKIHIVQKGDTLWKIAKKYGVNFEELKKMNSQLSNPDMIMPGMKVKVPTTSGLIKKETPMGQKPHPGVNLGVKKEMPIAEHPYAKEQPKPMPIAAVPIKEVPKAPYTPKMPIIPEIDINNYYMMNMANMTVKEAPQVPPAPMPPPVKEVPKKEMPVVEVPYCPPPPPIVEQPICAPICEPICEPECVPITPIMPGTGFCPPMDPIMPYPETAGIGMPVTHGVFPGAGMPMNPIAASGAGMPVTPWAAPASPGGPYVPPHFEDESSSSYMPQMQAMNPGYLPGGALGAPPSGVPMQQTFMQPGMTPPPSYPYPASPGYPAAGCYYPTEPYYETQGYPAGPHTGYAGFQGGYPATYSVPSPGYPVPAPGYPTGVYQRYREMPNEYSSYGFSGYSGQYPAQANAFPTAEYLNPGAIPPYWQMPYGYPPAGPSALNEYAPSMPAAGANLFSEQRGQLPVGTGRLNDCGCGEPSAAPQPAFAPPTPPIYMAPYSAPPTVAQPPFMNPYGMGPMGAAQYGMLRDDAENDENGS